MFGKKLLVFSVVFLVVLGSFPLINCVYASSELWNHVYGGSGADFAFAIVETLDGGFAVTGCTSSFGVENADVFLIKLDKYGQMEWNTTYGGAQRDCAYSLVATSDGGYALAGVTASFGEGGNDFWLIKTDSVGTVEWSQTYGDVNHSTAYSLVTTSDGGYALAGCLGNPSQFPISYGTTDFG